MSNFKPIDTERLIIRKLNINDSKDFFKYRSLPEVFRFQFFNPDNPNEADEFINRIAVFPNITNTWFQVGICLKESNKLIGDFGIHFLEDDGQVEIGYTIDPEFQGQGYATESLRSILDYLFNDLGKHRITASLDPDNIKSIKLLVRLGFRKEAHFIKSIKINHKWVDDCIYAMLSEEWN